MKSKNTSLPSDKELRRRQNASNFHVLARPSFVAGVVESNRNDNHHHHPETIYFDNDPCEGKERILRILKNAGIPIDDPIHLCRKLPDWTTVVRLYGEKPVVLGIETCSTYRAMIRHAGVRTLPRVAGLCNTGTHTLSGILRKNIGKLISSTTPRRAKEYDVPWGKHSFAKFRLNVTRRFGEQADLVLPIVIVRDPYRWMQGMCKAPYFASWAKADHCPNLIHNATGKPVRVVLNYALTKPFHKRGENYLESLPIYWNMWNRQYYESTYPRLMIRFEDLIFHSEEVYEQIQDCAGIPRTEEDQFDYQTKAAKDHGGAVGLLEQIIIHGKESNRISGFTDHDLNYAHESLDTTLMLKFGYNHPP